MVNFSPNYVADFFSSKRIFWRTISGKNVQRVGVLAIQKGFVAFFLKILIIFKQISVNSLSHWYGFYVLTNEPTRLLLMHDCWWCFMRTKPKVWQSPVEGLWTCVCVLLSLLGYALKDIWPKSEIIIWIAVQAKRFSKWAYGWTDIEIIFFGSIFTHSLFNKDKDKKLFICFWPSQKQKIFKQINKFQLVLHLSFQQHGIWENDSLSHGSWRLEALAGFISLLIPIGYTKEGQLSPCNLSVAQIHCCLWLLLLVVSIA